MNPDQKTRLLIGTLVAAVILVVGYALFHELGRVPEPIVRPTPPAISAEAPLSPAANPGMPLLRLQADNPVIANTGGHKASVTADSDLSIYDWSIQGGTFEGDTGGPTVQWTAGAGPEVVLTFKGTNAADRSSTATLRLPLRQLPAIARFESEPKVITLGSSAKLSWSATNTLKLVLDPGGQDVTKYDGPPMEVKPEATTMYTLTATNSTGVPITRELQIKVVLPPEIASFRAEPVTGSPDAFTVIGEFKGGKAELKNGSQVVASSEASPLRIQVADLKDGASLVLTVTNEAGTYLVSTLTFSTSKKY